MLQQLRELKDVRRIVFDVRGNGGGDSSVGGRIFEAATGGLEYDRRDIDGLARTYAQWRVSDVSFTALMRPDSSASSRKLYRAGSGPVAQVEKLLEELTAAKAAGRAWVEQADGYRVTRADVVRRNGKLRRFNGPVASADRRPLRQCLPRFRRPGALGSRRRPRRARHQLHFLSLYIEKGFAKLPSGNLLFIPLKVWRNRVRGNDEILVPDIPLDVDMDDDNQVVPATLDALAATKS